MISVLEEVCQSWLIDFPELRPSTRHLEVSYHAIKNTRRKMEDSHIIVPDLNALFGLKVRLQVGEVGFSCRVSDYKSEGCGFKSRLH